MSPSPRWLALFLVATLAVPSSVFALRAPQKEQPLQLTGLEEALRDSTFPSAVSVVPSALSNVSTGMEEQENPEKLGWGAWWATLGYWGPTRKVLLDPRFEEIRPDLRLKINRLVKLYVGRGWGWYWRDLKGLLRESIPSVAKGLAPGQFVASLDFAIFLVEHGMVAGQILRDFPDIAQNLTPEQFAAGMTCSMSLVERGGIHDPLGLLYELRDVVKVSPSLEVFSFNLRLLEETAVRLNGIRFQDLWSLLPAIVRLSQTPAEFQSYLSTLELFMARLAEKDIVLRAIDLAWLSKLNSTPESFRAILEKLEDLLIRMKEKDPYGVSLYALRGITESLTPMQFIWGLDLAISLVGRGINPRAILEELPIAGPMSPTPEILRANLQELNGFMNRLMSVGIYAEPWVYFGLSAVAQASQASGAFQENLYVFEELLVRLKSSKPPLNWSNISFEQIGQLVHQVMQLHRQGVDYAVQIIPEKGHYRQETREHREPPSPSFDDLYAGMGRRSLPSFETVKIYVLDSPQIIRLVSRSLGSPMEVKSLALDDSFLRSRGILNLLAQAYGEELQYPFGSEGQLHRWFMSQIVGEGVSLRVSRIGLFPGYYPLNALGQEVVLRVYTDDQERILMPINTILVRGEIERQGALPLHYQVFPRAEFDAMLASDGLRDWHILAEPLRPYRPLREAIPSSERVVEQLVGRNWIFRSLAEKSEVFEEDTLIDGITAVQRLVSEISGRVSPYLRWQFNIRVPPLVSIYALGSYLWEKDPNDLDLFIITEGNHPFEILELQKTQQGTVPMHIRVVGLDTLSKAVSGKPVENWHRIRLEAMVLYGSAVLIAGQDLFAKSAPPRENYPKLAEHFRGSIARLQTVPGLTEAQRRDKAERWKREATAIERFSAGLEEQPMRFMVDTSKGDSSVLRFAQWATLLIRAGAGNHIRFAGVATAQELKEAQLQMTDKAGRAMLADYIKTYDPSDPESYQSAFAVAQAMVFDEPRQLHPELVITRMDSIHARWFLDELDRLGIRNLFAPELRDEAEAYRSA